MDPFTSPQDFQIVTLAKPGHQSNKKQQLMYIRNINTSHVHHVKFTGHLLGIIYTVYLATWVYDNKMIL